MYTVKINIRCHPLHHFYCALPVPYVPVRVTRSALVTHRNTYAPPPCKTSQLDFYSPLSVSGTIFAGPVFNGEGLAGFNSSANAFLLA